MWPVGETRSHRAFAATARSATKSAYACRRDSSAGARAAIFGYGGYDEGEVRVGALVLVLCGFAALTFGGWPGGAIVFVHGMRVLSLVDEPAREAITPGGDEKARPAQ
ncbi:MAG: hypothetical protein ACRDMY_05280 [Gaiellaceae bacterium]